MHRLLLALAVLPLSGAALHATDPPRRLNVIVILADDFGWTDLAYLHDLGIQPAAQGEERGNGLIPPQPA
jgi:hypothetical protein